MTECKTCKCGWTVAPEQSDLYPGWYVMCKRCILSTDLYDNPEMAADAWNKGIYTPATKLIQKPFMTIDDLDNDGAVNLVEAIYRLAIKDYEEVEHLPDSNTKKEIENMYRYGYYTGLSLGEAGVRQLKRIVQQRREEREEAERKRQEESRKNQAS